jgi:P-type Cu2+ transporter
MILVTMTLAESPVDAVSSAASLLCFHCGLPVPTHERWRSAVLGELRDFCCGGCEAAARAIAASGLEDYYRLRTSSAPAVASGGAEARERLFDREELQSSFVRRLDGLREAALLLDGIRCPACLWLNEQRLRGLSGVVEVSVAYASRTARVRWNPETVALSEILAAVRQIGYEARPIDASHRAGLEREAVRRDASRLLFAGVLGMMVMSLALAAYLIGGPEAAGGLPLWETFARWCELAGTVILLAYPAQEFFAGAWRDLSRRRPGMDVPIVLGLLSAWGGSAWATLRGAGPVYYDAIAMLVFFVLLARALETRARMAAAAVIDRLAVVEPAAARRLAADGAESEIAAIDLQAGDRIRVRSGEVAPADGVILEGRSRFDEAVWTGEPWPRLRGPGETVVAGSCNRDQPVLLRVTRAGEDSTLAQVRRLIEKGLASRPRTAQLADAIANWLVSAVLLVAAATAVFWELRDPVRALPAVAAVLIVTCPCALALATPIALTLGVGRLASIGVVPARLAALESLARADTAALDKTGTVTMGVSHLERIESFGGLGQAEALCTAAALESFSVHPIARAISEAFGNASPARSAVCHDEGVDGIVDAKRWWIGSPPFALGPAAIPAELAGPLSGAQAEQRPVAVLSDRLGRGALFVLAEQLRPGARELVDELRRLGFRRTVLLSGDARERVDRLAATLGFEEAHGRMSTEGKLEWIVAQERSGAKVMYVGDGLNDTATLSAANVSFSFARAPQASRLRSDFLILGEDLSALSSARRVARRCRRILTQNVAWALSYNLLAVPLAAAGWVPPWAAAAGMSGSSIVVVANAMRLRRRQGLLDGVELPARSTV